MYRQDPYFTVSKIKEEIRRKKIYWQNCYQRYSLVIVKFMNHGKSQIKTFIKEKIFIVRTFDQMKHKSHFTMISPKVYVLRNFFYT